MQPVAPAASLLRPSACPGLWRVVPARDGGICRVKLPGGLLTSAQARAVAEAARLCGSGVLELTNRSNLQLRGVRDENHEPLVPRLLAAGLGPRNPAADDVRNLLLSPVAGRDRSAHLDTRPLAGRLLALLENARRYASPGKVRIAVHDTLDHVQVAIEDEGPGIPAALRADIFRPFMRADGSRSRPGGGSGLGLAVVKAIADAHGGQAYCVPGRAGGSRFVIELPRQ